MAFSPLRLDTIGTFPSSLPGNFAGMENPYLMSPELSGKFMGFDYGDKDDKEDEPKENENGNRMTDYEKEKLKLMQESMEFRNYILSPEYQDREYKRADDLAAAQMARAQEYGKEAAMYGYLYQGLPSQIAQTAFSKFAFADDALKGVQAAYNKLDSAGAIRQPQYMQLNA